MEASDIKILIGFECSGNVRDAFKKRGFDARSCDILPSDRPGPHYQCDIKEALTAEDWHAAIFFPPCTYLCSSGLHWNKRRPERQQKTEEALDLVRELLNLDIPFIALENPVGCIGTRIRKYDQKIQPWQFGHDASKGTCLWLKNLPKLEPTHIIEPRLVYGKPRWGNQTDSGQNKLGPSEYRAKLRSETYVGIAEAMADTWGRHILTTLTEEK